MEKTPLLVPLVTCLLGCVNVSATPDDRISDPLTANLAASKVERDKSVTLSIVGYVGSICVEEGSASCEEGNGEKRFVLYGNPIDPKQKLFRECMLGDGIEILLSADSEFSRPDIERRKVALLGKLEYAPERVPSFPSSSSRISVSKVYDFHLKDWEIVEVSDESCTLE